jgi:hypothetical protein
MDRPIIVILLLGSYDPQTKSYLEIVKEEIAKRFVGENAFSFLLNNSDVYISQTIQALVEVSNKRKAALFVFQDNALIDVHEIAFKKDLDGVVHSFLKEKYEVQEFNKLSVFSKYDILMGLARVLFLIRDKEETRGGEYVELMHALFQKHSEKIWFFKREGVRISEMLMEYLDRFGVKIRPYIDKQDLVEEIIRILRNILSSSESI